MDNVLDMNAFRARQRAQRRFCKDLAEVKQHEMMRPHKPATPTEAVRAAAQAAADYQGGQKKGELIEGWAHRKEAYDARQAAEGRTGPGKLEAYLDDILEKAYNGSMWAQFRLALIQLAEEPPGAAREQLQLTFPNMEPAQFEIWLDRATVEFDEYTNMLDNEDQP